MSEIAFRYDMSQDQWHEWHRQPGQIKYRARCTAYKEYLIKNSLQNSKHSERKFYKDFPEHEPK